MLSAETTDALRLSQAARLLGVETREMARLVQERPVRT